MHLLRKILLFVGSLLSLAGLLFADAPANPQLAVYSREVLDASMKVADSLWDNRAGLLAMPVSEHALARNHRVRQTIWYALGLFQRGGPGDDARAARAIEAVLAQQIDEPGAAWNGTFYRSTEEPQIPVTAIAWNEYDPNWRQFVGTSLALALIEFEARIPVTLRARMLKAIVRAVDGEQTHGRLAPSYTNIAIMHAFLCAFAGERCARPDLAKIGTTYMEEIYAGFRANNSFEEFNSPTYYGVDLYGLALWRAHGITPRMKALGAELEAALWRDTADFYHAGLRNICGPFDRAYGMDMRRYVALTGLWVRLALPEDVAPFPPLGGEMDHAHDFFYAPCFTLLGVRIPDDALTLFLKFPGEKLITRTLPRGRTATAWLSENIMIGAESAGLSRGVIDDKNQYQPATMHWRTPTGGIGWIRLVHAPRSDACAAVGTLTITGTGSYTFRVKAPVVTKDNFVRERWTLPGLNVRVESDASDFSISIGNGFVDVTYSEASHFTLRVESDLSRGR